MATLFGSGIRRREDPRLITGTATYTDDVKLPWHTTIGSFSNLVYSQLKNPEKQASTMQAPVMPKPN